MLDLKRNDKIILYILIPAVFLLLAFFYFTDNLNLDYILEILKIPAIIVSVVLVILLNFTTIQKKMINYQGGRNIESMKKNIFMGEGEEVVLIIKDKFIIRWVFGFIPFIYFSSIFITNKRIKFNLFPFISIPSESIFFKFESANFAFPTQHIVALKQLVGGLQVHTSTGQNIIFYIKEQEQVDVILSMAELSK